jgi:hypothetical protein
MASSGLLRRVALVRTDVSEEPRPDNGDMYKSKSKVKLSLKQTEETYRFMRFQDPTSFRLSQAEGHNAAGRIRLM